MHVEGTHTHINIVQHNTTHAHICAYTHTSDDLQHCASLGVHSTTQRVGVGGYLSQSIIRPLYLELGAGEQTPGIHSRERIRQRSALQTDRRTAERA
jgi:hypothetical protein